MPRAFIMIKTELGSEKEVLDQLRKIDEIKESSLVYGIYDLSAKISAETMDQLNNIVTLIRDLDKIQTTLTLILIEKEK